MTAKELIEILPSPDEFYGNKDHKYTPSGGQPLEKFIPVKWDGEEDLDERVGPIELVARYGGEGCGDEHWFVFWFPEHGCYLRIYGYYDSNNGASYDGAAWQEVTPKEVKIIEFEEVK